MNFHYFSPARALWIGLAGFIVLVSTLNIRTTFLSTPSLVSFSGLIGGLWSFITGLNKLRQKRMVENTPTSKIRSLSMGRVEIQGTVDTFEEITLAPISKTNCVFYAYELQKWVEREDDDGRDTSYWKTIDKLSHSVPFFVQDDTGKVLVDPKNAIVTAQTDRNHQSTVRAQIPDHIMKRFFLFKPSGKLRFSEQYIEPGDTIFVLGYAGDNPHVAEASGTAHAADTMIRHKAGMPFYISDQSEKDTIKKLARSGWLHLVGGIALSIFSFVLGAYLLL